MCVRLSLYFLKIRFLKNVSIQLGYQTIFNLTTKFASELLFLMRSNSMALMARSLFRRNVWTIVHSIMQFIFGLFFFFNLMIEKSLVQKLAALEILELNL